MAKKCKAKTRKGTPCPNPAGASSFCFVHDPRRAAERAAARKRGGLNRRRHPAATAPVKLERAQDVLALANTVIQDAARLDNSPARGRLMLAAGSAALDALRVGELQDQLTAMAERMAELEKRLEARGEKDAQSVEQAPGQA